MSIEKKGEAGVRTLGDRSRQEMGTRLAWSTGLKKITETQGPEYIHQVTVAKDSEEVLKLNARRIRYHGVAFEGTLKSGPEVQKRCCQ